jgi:hypothetical protein
MLLVGHFARVLNILGFYCFIFKQLETFNRNIIQLYIVIISILIPQTSGVSLVDAITIIMRASQFTRRTKTSFSCTNSIIGREHQLLVCVRDALSADDDRDYNQLSMT